ncbi:hypothetical protein PV755_45670 [Streptomyces caniscabiei]|uniref:hypothetical protein n=1 Tax=Streptomyces caniscabiei TaxID=2746961 RepID=UPI0029B44FBC|nr:hypothetical protein [Streptomyces caniscabiei]MDX3516105.1 hypothetical protein [Streptomyces caniscabiei]
MSPKRFETADDEGPNPALTPHQTGLMVGSPPPAPEAAVAQETLVAQRRAEEAKAIREARESKTRRSWYTSTAAADAFQAAVDDLHHATRVPKHEVVAALLQAAVEQAPKVERKLQAQVARVRPVRGV